MRIPNVGRVLLLTLTGCPAPDDGATDPSTSAATSADTTTTGTTTTATTSPAPTTTDATTTSGDTTSGTTSDTTSATDDTTSGDPACACFEPSGSDGEFTILCPAPVKASISAFCGDPCTFDDEAAIATALTFLATGEPGIVRWSVDESYFAPPMTPRILRDPRALATAATCNGQFCHGGVHILTGDGKIYTQEIDYDDLAGEIGPLVGATLRDATYFNMCAQDPDAAARFACVINAAMPPTFADECVPGDVLGYY